MTPFAIAGEAKEEISTKIKVTVSLAESASYREKIEILSRRTMKAEISTKHLLKTTYFIMTRRPTVYAKL